ncbi:LysR family transcriptional regulator [Telmatospirillum sp. J64-1]|uniref:LysR family transcriptional regulator n=1 Tax=Telmatospirillum sp. J64-1 TaxID=2502183 RepID=UPI00115F575B|nr:LysR family transcriptional regulator [Telmatospirillum sp. J64-1]
MRHATFRQLRVFDAIARHGSFSRAAEEMSLTQPTLSMQVKKISDSVGLPLFEQVGKKVYLTEAGRALHRMCREVFDSIDHFEMTLDDIKGVKRGSLRIAAVTTAEYFLPRLLGPFCNAYPGIAVTLELIQRDRVLDRLRNNHDDLYVFGQPPQDPEVVTRPFLANPLVVVAPAGHPLAGQGRQSLERVMQEPFLMRETGSGTRNAMERFFEDRGLHPRLRMELGSNEAIKQGVMGGLGLAVMSRHAIHGISELVELDVEDFPILKQWYLVWPAGRQVSVAAQALLDHLSPQED